MLKQFLPTLSKHKFIITGFCLMIMIHILMLVIFSRHNSGTEYKVNRDVLARQAINLIQTVQTTPIEQQNKLVEKINLPNFTVDLGPKATNPVHFEKTSLWQVLVKISDQKPNIKFSYLLSPDRWLNIAVEIEPSSLELQTLLFSLETLLILITIFILWLINRYTVPIQRFSLNADRFGVDLQTQLLPEKGPKVVMKLSRAMNRMQERIRNLIQGRTQMLAALSHDLRTPITRLKLRSLSIDDETIQHKMVHDLDEMEAMIAETLSFAKHDNHKEQYGLINLNSLLSSVCEDFQDTGHDVQFDNCNHPLAIRGGSIALRRVFSNLINNAIKYGKSAQLSLHHLGDEAMCFVDDDGPGLPTEQYESVFLPFYRAESSRSRLTGGTGLGLAVAKDIIQAHGGDISLDKGPTGGLRVIVKLPLG